MGKITVKHYLHKSTSKKAGEKDLDQPVYVQVTVKRQVNRMRSQAHKLAGMTEFEMLVTKEEFEEAIKRNYTLGRAIAIERNLIEDIFTFVDPFNNDAFSIKEFALIYQIASESIASIIDNEGKSILGGLMNDEWIQAFYMLDLSKPFDEIVEGLELIGSNNKAFLNSVLKDKYLQASLVSLRNIGLFLNSNFTDSEGYSDYTKRISFYWFKQDLSKKYIEFLIQNKFINNDQKQTFEEFFAFLQESVLPIIKGLTGVS